MSHVSENERNQIIGHLKAGSSISRVSRVFHMRKGTVYYLRRCYQATGSIRDMPRSGRPRIMTPAQDRYIHMTHLQNCFQTAQSTANTLPGPHRILSVNTVLRPLHNEEIQLFILFTVQDSHRYASKHACSGQIISSNGHQHDVGWYC